MISKQTKIVATISDLNCSPEFIRSLHDAGMDVARLNTAFQTLADSEKVVANIRAVSERIAVLVDTKGPEVRTLEMPEKIWLNKGDLIKIKSDPGKKPQTGRTIYVNYKHFVRDVPKEARVLIDDGSVELIVEKKNKDYLLARAMNEGEVKGRKSINTPGVKLNLPSLSEKDKDFIAWAAKQDLDFIAHSFVRNKADVMAIQNILDRHKSKIKIIAKIENSEGVNNIDEILDHAYGVMVARGDLGVEIPAEEVPLIQKKLIKICRLRQKPIITATQMLHTMIDSPRPTRAEVSDVANAVLDGTDALMLSGETASGKYPLAAVKIMAKIAQTTEAARQAPKDIFFHTSDKITDFLDRAAVQATRDLPIKEILISSVSGHSAALISSYRCRVPVFVKCFDKRLIRELALSYGVHAHFYPKKLFNQKLIIKVLRELVKKEKLNKKDLIIYLSAGLEKIGKANDLEICEVGKYVSW